MTQILRKAFSLAIAISWLAGAALAQEFKSDAPDAEAFKLRGAAEACIRTPGRYAQTRAQVDEYFNKFYFPSMTGDTPDDLSRLGARRFDLFKKYLWTTEDESLQKGLTDLTYAAMVNIVKPQQPLYHPAVRYNAILTLGMLDEQYAREGATPRPPKPLPRATTLLTKLVGTATTQNIVAPPVILGAVIGLERHAQYRDALDAASKQAMTAALLKLVTHDQPIQDMDRGAYSWMRLRAASALANLGSAGQNNSVHDGLVKLTASLPSIDDRCSAAALFAKINYDGAKVDGVAAADGLYDLARDLATTESKRAEEFQKARLGTGGGFVPSVPSGYGQGMMDGTTPQETYPKRQVLDRLADLKTGLAGLRPTMPAEGQAKLDAVIAAIDPVIAVAMDKSSGELKLTQAIVAMAAAIGRAVPAGAATASADEKRSA